MRCLCYGAPNLQFINAMEAIVIILKTTLSVKMQHLEDVVELARDAAAAILIEPGCLAYEIYLQAERPGCLVLWQQWQSEEEAAQYADSAGAEEFLEMLYSYTVQLVDHQQFRVEEPEEMIVIEEEPLVYLGEEVVVH